uniref:AlNc14C4G614 protein n=1 Tax=Albugo laibachii Nc14 TaxID=890382 RepID=F0W0H2_9STRA|nr:AlNc14C4G614 [Albugo laibachii Nc14]|eukprot:CCA14544.1 AlNc14C4G614 [Albugo laibachii Nc14]
MHQTSFGLCSRKRLSHSFFARGQQVMLAIMKSVVFISMLSCHAIVMADCSNGDINVAGATILQNSTAATVKNKVLQHNNIALIGNNLAIRKNDLLRIKESAEQIPAGVVLLLNDRDALRIPREMQNEDGTVSAKRGYLPAYRIRFRYHDPRFGFLYGYRYPLWYWRRFGPQVYPTQCGYGRALGDFFYC